MKGERNPRGSNMVDSFLGNEHSACQSLFRLNESYLNVSMSPCDFNILPSVLIEGNSSFLQLCLLRDLITATEFDKPWYNLMASMSLLLESMLPSMYIEQRTVSVAFGSSGFFFFTFS